MSEELLTADKTHDGTTNQEDSRALLLSGIELSRFLLKSVRESRDYYLGKTQERPEVLIGELYDDKRNGFIMEYFAKTVALLRLRVDEGLSADLSATIAEFKAGCDEELRELAALAEQIRPHIGTLQGMKLASAITTFTLVKDIYFRDLTTPRSELYLKLSQIAYVECGLGTARTLLGQIGEGFKSRERQLSAEAAPTADEKCNRLLDLLSRIERRQLEHGKTLHVIDIHTTPAIEGFEKLFEGNTDVQRMMFLAGFERMESGRSKRPRAAATAVFDEFDRQRVPGRYNNRESFCTLFARKWELHSRLPRL